MPRAYSQDLRWRAIWLAEILGFGVDEVSLLLQISTKTISRHVRKFRMLGHVDTAVIVFPNVSQVRSICNKTPTQALTPPAEKIGKSLTYV